MTSPRMRIVLLANYDSRCARGLAAVVMKYTSLSLEGREKGETGGGPLILWRVVRCGS